MWLLASFSVLRLILGKEIEGLFKGKEYILVGLNHIFVTAVNLNSRNI